MTICKLKGMQVMNGEAQEESVFTKIELEQREENEGHWVEL